MSYDTSKMSVEEIRNTLVENCGLSREAVDSIKGKKSLVNLLNASITDAAYEATDDNGLKLFTDVPDDEMIDSPLDTVADANGDSLPPVSTPDVTDPDWSDFVISHLTENELFEGAPKVSGLRRVTELLLGEIVRSETTVVQAPTQDNERRATVIHSVTLRSDDGVIRVSQGAADAFSGNSDRMFAAHPVALAETRAEGRALRRLLRLSSSVVTAEEKVKPTEKFDDFILPDTNKIAEVQITGADVTGRRININLRKVVDKNFPNVNNINELSNDDGINLLNILSSYQSTGVPEDLKGYESNWRLKTEVKE